MIQRFWGYVGSLAYTPWGIELPQRPEATLEAGSKSAKALGSDSIDRK